MAKKKLTPEQESDIKMLLANNEMLQKSKQEIIERGNKGAERQINDAINDVRKKVEAIDPSAVAKLDEYKVPKKVKKPSAISTILDDTDIAFLGLSDVEETEVVQETKREVEKVSEAEIDAANVTPYVGTKTVIAEESAFNETDPSATYDIIELPSGGQVYKSKISRVPVGYLTAYDENIITSPNLYKDGLVIDILLKNKILNNAINPDELVSGDADAITLYLRATSYGPDFPIVVTDPDTGEQFETVIDLTTLKPRDFKLVGDENGYFDFTTPIKKDVIKFRYLTRKQEKQLQKLLEIENAGTRAALLDTERDAIGTVLTMDNSLSEADRKTMESALEVMEKWANKLRETSTTEFNRVITNNLMFQVVAVNGNEDRQFIKKYINGMPARDSLMLRRYINENMPGINFEVDVERPESLGGGSFKTFLNWDSSIFLNISELRD